MYTRGNITAPQKVALLFVGRIKAYEHQKHVLQKIKDTYKPTVFCSLNKKTKSDYTKRFCDYMDITDDRLNIEVTPPYSEYINNVKIPDEMKGKWGNSNSAIQNVYSWLYHLKKAYSLLEIYQNKNNIKFDVVLYYRVDINTTVELNIPNPIKNNTIYVPRNEDCADHRGICAVFFYGNESVMKYICNLIDKLEYMTTKQNILYSVEALLKTHIDNNNINIERFPYYSELNPARHEPHPEANLE